MHGRRSEISAIFLILSLTTSRAKGILPTGAPRVDVRGKGPLYTETNIGAFLPEYVEGRRLVVISTIADDCAVVMKPGVEEAKALGPSSSMR